MTQPKRLYVVAECPASPGFGGVVALLSTATGRLVFFAPCCGIAWRDAPVDGRLDVVTALPDLEPDGVRLPSRAEVGAAAPTLEILRDEPADTWLADIPGVEAAD